MTQIAMFEPGSERPTAAACRRDALQALTPRQVNDGHRRILEALASGALTDEELQDVTGLSPNTERPRRGELVEMGMVREDGTKRPTKSGRLAAVWRLA